jgi:hypothetical protein
MFLMTFFGENDDFVREKRYSKSETSSRKVTLLQMRGNHVGKRKENAKFRTFYWKSRGKTNFI